MNAPLTHPVCDTRGVLSDSIAGRWLAPLAEGRVWRALGYLWLGLLSTLWWFTATVVVLAVSLPLLIVGVGFALLRPAFGSIAVGARAERARAGLLGLRIPARATTAGVGPLSDPVRWRQVGHHLSAWFVAIGLFGASMALWGGGAYLVSLPFWGWAVGLSLPTALALALGGVGVIGLAARVTVPLALGGTTYCRWLLGPDQVSAMQERVQSLTADRAGILDAVARERRRIERNLHDGVQQRLVALGIDIGLAETMLDDRPDEARELLRRARETTRASIGELRSIGRGLHPAVLDDRGLDAALSAVAAACPVPVELRCRIDERPPPPIEEAAYYVVSEAMSNVMKHAEARTASIELTADAVQVRISVYDDGVGGATADRGSGLAGIAARVRGLDGTFELGSPDGGPTRLDVTLPIKGALR